MGVWINSHEEDTLPKSEWKHFRKAGYHFPPARGRAGFILLSDHRFALIKPSSNDGRDTLWGTWKYKHAKQNLRISIPGVPLSEVKVKKLTQDIWLVKMN